MLARQRLDRQSLSASDDRDHQPAGRVDGDAEVDLAPAQQPLGLERRVEVAVLQQGGACRPGDERQERQLALTSALPLNVDRCAERQSAGPGRRRPRWSCGPRCVATGSCARRSPDGSGWWPPRRGARPRTPPADRIRPAARGTGTDTGAAGTTGGRGDAGPVRCAVLHVGAGDVTTAASVPVTVGEVDAELGRKPTCARARRRWTTRAGHTGVQPPHRGLVVEAARAAAGPGSRDPGFRLLGRRERGVRFRDRRRGGHPLTVGAVTG